MATDKRAAIHAEAPDFVDMSVSQEILVTGIKVVDLLAPYAKGGKIGTCADGLDQTVLIRFLLGEWDPGRELWNSQVCELPYVIFFCFCSTLFSCLPLQCYIV